MKQLIISCVPFWIFFIIRASGQFDVGFTLQKKPGLTTTISCYSDENYEKIGFARKLDTGHGGMLPSIAFNGKNQKEKYSRLSLPSIKYDGETFGAFLCKFEKEREAMEIVTLNLPPSHHAELYPLSAYKVANIGDSVEFEVNISMILDLPIKWQHNGEDVPSWNDKLRVKIEDVKTSNIGIYECFHEGRRSKGVHAIIRLIVRKCTTNMYGKECDQKCPPCYNGGICHDVQGICVCPAGFTGANCEMACGGNRFGKDCSKFCIHPDYVVSEDDGCLFQRFCKPDPYGCSCAPGFQGSDCRERCAPGWYGADCTQSCHCAKGSGACNRITGSCEGGCTPGWSGGSCQIKGHFDGSFTLQKKPGLRHSINCYSDVNYEKIEFSRMLDTGHDNDLLQSSCEAKNQYQKYASITFPTEKNDKNKFGAFQCKIEQEYKTVKIVTLNQLPSHRAELYPLNAYKVTNIGESIELEVNISKRLELPIKWQHNGKDVPSWNNQQRVKIEDVQTSNAGIYECYYEGRRSEGVHAIMRLIVRKCPANMYGHECNQNCLPCYNGGICHDEWGTCVCPAGFTGTSCEVACGGNRFGENCSTFCVHPDYVVNEEGCIFQTFCKPDPYGCSCAPGYKGSDCREHCAPGWYGADCKQPCRCDNASNSCNRITGTCEAKSDGNFSHTEGNCGDPPTVRNGYPIDSNISRWHHGALVLYACHHNRTLVNRGKVVCHSGDWVGIPPECMDECNTDSLKVYITLEVPGNITRKHFETLDIRCRQGHVASSPGKLISCHNGTWEVPDNFCIEETCSGEPPAVENGKPRELDRKPGSEVGYVCDKNYILIGNSTVQCRFGKWEGHTPVCTRPCESGWYGSDCKQPCHCAKGSSFCNRVTGECDGGCTKGWYGESCQGYFDTSFTLLGYRTGSGTLWCYTDENLDKVEYSTKIDTGNGVNFKSSAHKRQSSYTYPVNSVFTFGAFQCKFRGQHGYMEIVTLLQSSISSADLYPWSAYKVANTGDTVDLNVTISKKLELPIKWLHNGQDVPSWNDQLSVKIQNVQTANSGIYECFYEGRRSIMAHALIKLIVRKCRASMYGDKCDQRCPPCYNGGVCHDILGLCVCPSGFTGNNCEVVCPYDYIGVSCSQQCGNGCATYHFCKPDPYGCSCGPGLKGYTCSEHCSPGWYGADCKQPCHCANGPNACDKRSGSCSGGCTRGWSGNSCQIEDSSVTPS